jgi:hypothetical protein
MTAMERRPVGEHRTASTEGPFAEAARPPVTITSAAAARRYVRSVVGEGWRSPSGPPTEAAMIDLLLVVSELVTNAVRHGGGLAGFDVGGTTVPPSPPLPTAPVCRPAPTRAADTAGR